MQQLTWEEVRAHVGRYEGVLRREGFGFTGASSRCYVPHKLKMPSRWLATDLSHWLQKDAGGAAIIAWFYQFDYGGGYPWWPVVQAWLRGAACHHPLETHPGLAMKALDQQAEVALFFAWLHEWDLMLLCPSTRKAVVLRHDGDITGYTELPGYLPDFCELMEKAEQGNYRAADVLRPGANAEAGG